jgi:hypothetical protein
MGRKKTDSRVLHLIQSAWLPATIVYVNFLGYEGYKLSDWWGFFGMIMAGTGFPILIAVSMASRVPASGKREDGS